MKFRKSENDPVLAMCSGLWKSLGFDPNSF